MGAGNWECITVSRLSAWARVGKVSGVGAGGVITQQHTPTTSHTHTGNNTGQHTSLGGVGEGVRGWGGAVGQAVAGGVGCGVRQGGAAG